MLCILVFLITLHCCMHKEDTWNKNKLVLHKKLLHFICWLQMLLH